ncbi:MAG: Asp-tRNA(Asn)/Glu-tRNA(Gln) amidotransferase subunit GatC [Syntrophomonadaceae bacterium]|jgi:aspartyl-tRNA(Asn)/glutamyl-tRNA(Gln) amidotransferase subunit C|nr:Asp-tRNA(Asn)/Glu-tRNA(Gln) amidotransferase subunit GatC [Syntrophomonadaceae bacterium]
MIITRQQVEHVAWLARLELSEEEKELYTTQLNSILEYMRKLDRLETSGVEPMAHVLPVHNVFRPDEVQPSIDQEDALENAPDRQGEFFRVPRIV